MNSKVAPTKSSQLAGSAGKHERTNAGARLVMSEKDIDGAIMVQASGLMLAKLRVACRCNPSTLFASYEFFELGFGEDCYA
jgi:hypothetical protein